MANIIQRIELTLRSFYIFNSTLGRKEGEESKKILFYHPQDIELNTKINDVGLSEAIISFTGTFDCSDGCKALHTQKTTQIFYQPEENYWMVLVINVPKEIRSKDGVEIADYKGNEVHDHIYRATLKQCYNMFRLFAGTFGMILENSRHEGEDPHDNLAQKLELFYSKYLLTLKLAACDVVDAMRSIQYLPLDKFLFLRVHNFVNMIQATFSIIADTIFLYNDQVVCSKICPLDLYCIHEYLVGTIFPKAAQAELAGGSLNRNNSNSSEFYRSGGFVTGPENTENCSKPPKVHILHDGELQCFHLIIYRVMNATLCLLIRANQNPLNEFYLELHSFMGPQLASIASDIGESLTKPANTPNATKSLISSMTNSCTGDSEALGPKYLFINEQSLKHISNIYLDRRRPKANSIPANVMNLIADLKSSGDSNVTEEVQIKTTNDFWIVKKSCNWRHFYVIIFNSTATLLDVTNDARRIFEQEITDDVFFDK